MMERKPRLGVRAFVLVLLLGGCSRNAEHSEPLAEVHEVAQPGIDFRQVDIPQLGLRYFSSGRATGGNTILEIIGGGVGCIDIDEDGNCDLIFAGGGQIDHDNQVVSGASPVVMRNEGSFDFANVTAATRLNATDLYSHGITVADFDHDGWMDILIYGFHGLRLYRNQGDGTFRDATDEAGLHGVPWATAVAWGDFNLDGWLDLYVGSYVNWDFSKHQTCPAPDGLPDVCSPNAFAAVEDRVYFGRASGRFELAARLGNHPAASGATVGRALGVLVARLDSELTPFIYVANDLSANFLLRYETDSGMTDHAVASGVAVDALGAPNGSMGVTLLDFAGGGHFDLLVTNFEHEQIAFYRNQGSRLFRHASRDVALNTMNPRVVGFGVVAADFNGNGFEDVVLTSGHVNYRPDRGTFEQEPVLLMNAEGREFYRAHPACDYFQKKSCGRGLAVADLDNDGDLDVVITHLEQPPAVLENLADLAGSWLRVRLVGRQSPRTPIGAIVTVSTTQRQLSRQLFGGGSYLSQSQQELFFGWPEPGTVTIEVQWPGGAVTTQSDVLPNQQLLIVEPRM